MDDEQARRVLGLYRAQRNVALGQIKRIGR